MGFTSGITWFRQNKKQGDCQRREKRKELAAVDLMQLNVLAGKHYRVSQSLRTTRRSEQIASSNARITRRCRREAAGSYGRTGGWVIG